MFLLCRRHNICCGKNRIIPERVLQLQQLMTWDIQQRSRLIVGGPHGAYKLVRLIGLGISCAVYQAEIYRPKSLSPLTKNASDNLSLLLLEDTEMHDISSAEHLPVAGKEIVDSHVHDGEKADDRRPDLADEDVCLEIGKSEEHQVGQGNENDEQDDDFAFESDENDDIDEKLLAFLCRIKKRKISTVENVERKDMGIQFAIKFSTDASCLANELAFQNSILTSEYRLIKLFITLW